MFADLRRRAKVPFRQERLGTRSRVPASRVASAMRVNRDERHRDRGLDERLASLGDRSVAFLGQQIGAEVDDGVAIA